MRSIPRPLQLAIHGFVILVVMGGLYAWKSFEVRKATDAVTLGALIQLQSALIHYHQDRFSYPATPASGLVGIGGSECLSSEGFLGSATPSCRKKSYGYFEEPFAYQAFSGEKAMPCTDGAECNSFAVEFEMKSGSIFSKGVHTLTPKGIQ